jgi:hypothetical protein
MTKGQLMRRPTKRGMTMILRRLRLKMRRKRGKRQRKNMKRARRRKKRRKSERLIKISLIKNRSMKMKKNQTSIEIQWVRVMLVWRI